MGTRRRFRRRTRTRDSELGVSPSGERADPLGSPRASKQAANIPSLCPAWTGLGLPSRGRCPAPAPLLPPRPGSRDKSWQAVSVLARWHVVAHGWPAASPGGRPAKDGGGLGCVCRPIISHSGAEMGVDGCNPAAADPVLEHAALANGWLWNLGIPCETAHACACGANVVAGGEPTRGNEHPEGGLMACPSITGRGTPSGPQLDSVTCSSLWGIKAG